MPEAPKLSAQTRAAALAEAMAARAARADARAALKSGTLSIDEFLQRAYADSRLAGMRVSAVVGSLPGFGPARTAELLAELGIAESRRMRGLGPKQRVALHARLSDSAESSA